MSDLNENLPIDMEGRDSLLENFQSVPDLAKSYLSLRKKMGESSRIPSEGAEKEEWSGFYRSLGAPESPDGYTVPEGISDELSGTISNMRKSALEKGVTTGQWEELVTPLANLEKERMEKQSTAKETALEQWKQTAKEKYGSDFDSKAALAERAYTNFVKNNPDLSAVFDATGMGYHPEVMDFMIGMGQNMADESTPMGASGGNMGTDYKSLAARARKIAKTGNMTNPRHPEYEEDYSEFMKIQTMLMEAGYQGMSDPRLATERSWP